MTLENHVLIALLYFGDSALFSFVPTSLFILSKKNVKSITVLYFLLFLLAYLFSLKRMLNQSLMLFTGLASFCYPK